MDYTLAIVICVCAITFYRAGQMERSWAVLWAFLSVAASFATLFILNLGLIAVFGSQVILFLAITAFRVWKKD